MLNIEVFVTSSFDIQHSLFDIYPDEIIPYPTHENHYLQR